MAKARAVLGAALEGAVIVGEGETKVREVGLPGYL